MATASGFSRFVSKGRLRSPGMGSDDEAAAARQDRHELVQAFIAGTAMLAFAWAGFQSALWVRERFLLSDEAASLSEQAFELSSEADRSEERDALLYVEWQLALDRGEEDVARGIFGLFRDPFQDYLERVERDDRGIPVVDPRDDPSYDVFGSRQAATNLDDQASAVTTRSREASRTGARFGVLSLVFAAVLAVVGIAGRLELPGIRRGLTLASASLLVVGVVVLVALPTIIEWP